MDRPENVNIECDQVSQLVETFKSQQHDHLDDDKLFYGHLRKCRCCFMQLTKIRGPNIIHQWHRETFMAMTGLELSFGRLHSNYLCLNCIELLKIFTQLKVAADGMQKVQNRYIEHHRQLFEVVTVKQEVEDENDDDTDDENQVNDANDQSENSNNIKDDGPQRPDVDYCDQDHEDESKNIAAEEFNHDEVATDQTEEIKGPAELAAEMKECSVQLERLDPMTIAQYSSNKRATESDADTTTIRTAHSDTLTAVMKVSSCDLCGFETEIKGILAHHIDTRHKNPDKQEGNEFKCPIDGCNKTFKNKKSLTKHRNDVHKRDSQEDSTCNVCGKVCKNKAALRKHQQVHIKKLECDICGKSFVKKSHLIDHTQTHHINNSKFDCTKCSKSFKSQWKLKGHQRNAHDVKKFKCDQCTAAFAHPGLLTDHVKVKHEGKSYPCSYPGCSEKFSRKGHASRHLREVHKLNGDEYKEYCKLIKMC